MITALLEKWLKLDKISIFNIHFLFIFQETVKDK